MDREGEKRMRGIGRGRERGERERERAEYSECSIVPAGLSSGWEVVSCSPGDAHRPV